MQKRITNEEIDANIADMERVQIMLLGVPLDPQTKDAMLNLTDIVVMLANRLKDSNDDNAELKRIIGRTAQQDSNRSWEEYAARQSATGGTC